ncbi:MAG: hypothetical protein HYZ42_05625 [Bacteroidetes bacterium]|nr:hypothetical protein [Bacteroidota bacterium]
MKKLMFLSVMALGVMFATAQEPKKCCSGKKACTEQSKKECKEGDKKACCKDKKACSGKDKAAAKPAAKPAPASN